MDAAQAELPREVIWILNWLQRASGTGGCSMKVPLP